MVLSGLDVSQVSFTTICIAVWILLVIAFIVAEIISLGLTSIWFAVGAMAAAISAMLGAPIWLQCILFVVVSAIALGSTRGLAAKYLNNRLEKTNAEGLIGDTVYVIEEINNEKATGKVRIGDLEWTARTKTDAQIIPKDAKVIVSEIRGVKCIVEPVRDTNAEPSTV